MLDLNRLELLMKENGLKAPYICEKLGSSRYRIADWKRGKGMPNDNEISILADLLHTTPEYLKGESDKKHNVISFSKHSKIKIPVLGYVKAGIPIEAVQEILDYEEIPAEWAESGEYFALSVKGNSMEPRICEGDVVIVKKQEDVESGELAIVLVNGEDATVKKVMKNSHGITLVPFNPTFQPMVFSNKEIMELPVSILGRVIELRAKF